MPKNPIIRAETVQGVVQLIRGWPDGEALSWDSVCERSASLVGYVPTRQALSSKEAIVGAFQAKKKGLRERPQTRSARPASLAVAEQTIARLRAENEELTLINDRLKEKFVVWQYNASVGGVYPEELNRPLPRIDREASAPSESKRKKPAKPALKAAK